MDITALIPNNSEAFEIAVAAGASDNLEVPYAEILDPYETDPKFFPFLRLNHSVDLWFDDWSDDRKREMIAQCAGSSTIHPGEQLADFKGTLKGLQRYLEFVDAQIIDRISFPDHFTFGRSAIGNTPIAHPAFKSRYLIKVEIERPVNCFEIGRSALGKAAIRDVDLEPIRRAKQAATIAKFEHIEIVVSFAHRRAIRVSDEVLVSEEHTTNKFVDRNVI